MAGETEQVPTKLSMAELDAEFGLDDVNSDAELSDAVDEAAKGNLDSIEKETVASKGIDTEEIERTITEEQALEGLDDNVEIMEQLEKQEEERARARAEAADEEGEEDEEEGLEVEGGEAEEEGEEEEADDDAEDEGGAEEEGEDQGEEASDEPDEEKSAEEEGEDEVDELTSWVRSELGDPDLRHELMQTLLEEGAEVSYTVDGKTVREPLKDALRKASGYGGQEKVDSTLREARTAQQTAERQLAEAEQKAGQADQAIEQLTQHLGDPEKFSGWLTQRAELPYLKQLSERLQETIDQAETDPMAFETRREMAGIKEMLGQVLQNGGSREADGSADGRTPEGADDRRETPSDIPDDLGFVAGEGYPKAYIRIASREVTRFLDGANALRDEPITAEQVLDAWKREGKQRPILDVAQGLVNGAARDDKKKSIAGSPPKKRTPDKGRKKSGTKPVGDRGRKKEPTSWEDIPKTIVKELQGAGE